VAWNPYGCSWRNPIFPFFAYYTESFTAKARGYGTVKHLITISYLVAGKLTHLPASPFNLKACATPAA
jgi:hypothetical protein